MPGAKLINYGVGHREASRTVLDQVEIVGATKVDER